MKHLVLAALVAFALHIFTSHHMTGTFDSTSNHVPVIEKVVEEPEVVETEPVFKDMIAPGLQIVQVPPPLDLMGRHPYQCYFNGEPIKIPVETVKKILAKHGDPTKDNPDFNIHNFTGNLRFVEKTSINNNPINVQ